MKLVADTSALVALINPADEFHEWAVRQWEEATSSASVCEAVLVEAHHLLRRVPHGRKVLNELWKRHLVVIDFALKSHEEPVRTLMERYLDVPMSLADACIVRMSELSTERVVWTLDRDFRVYRRHGRQAIPLLMPEGLK